MGGWMIGYSLPMELELVLYFAAPKDHLTVANLPPALQELVQRVPEDWRSEWLRVFGEVPRSFASMNLMGSWAGSLYESNYRKATLPMRELRLADAIAVRAEQLRAYGERAEPAATDLATLQTLEQQLDFFLYRLMGLPNPNVELMRNRIATEVARAAAFLKDGDLHSSFWWLLDRFYYETYVPWRESRLPYMDDLAQRAALVLGGTPVTPSQSLPALGTAGEEIRRNLMLGTARYRRTPDALLAIGNASGSAPMTFPSGILYYSTTPPALDWLPKENQLRSQPAVMELVQQGKTVVYFWVEPFELFDSGYVEPGIFAASFAEPGIAYENFRQFVTHLGSRSQALADPTRLTIMRMIRHFSLDNTTMSNYMGISRPTVSEHARILREAGFITTHQEGRQVRHEVQSEAVADYLRDLIEFLDLDIKL